MKLFKHMTDGGKDSVVEGYWLIEWKALFSIVLLKFNNGSREAYHSHAFNCFSWVLKGKLIEDTMTYEKNVYKPSIWPFGTYRRTFHRVTSISTTWVLSFRGPWSNLWLEWLPDTEEFVVLTDRRREVYRSAFLEDVEDFIRLKEC